MSTVQVNAQMILTVLETLTAGVPDVATGNATITHNAFNSSLAISASTSPPASACAAFTTTLSAGAATVDFTALAGTNGVTVDGTGLRVQAIKIKNIGANNMTFKFGASNPYNLLGASWTLILAASQELLLFGNNLAPLIASGAKNMDVSGTGSQQAQIIVVMG